MELNVFLILLLAVSLLTGLVTEGIKKPMDEAGRVYRSNLIAGAVAIILSVAIDAAYVIITETALNDKLAVYLIALVLLSWLSSMLGYDKVKQTILQIKG